MTICLEQRGFTLIEMMVVIVIIAILTGFAMLHMNQLSPDSAASCSAQLRPWLADLTVKAEATDQTIYVEAKQGNWQAVVLDRQGGKWTTRSVDRLDLAAACTLDRPHGSDDDTTQRLPAVLADVGVAVTPSGRWRTRDGSTYIELIDRAGARQRIELQAPDRDREEGGSG